MSIHPSSIANTSNGIITILKNIVLFIEGEMSTIKVFFLSHSMFYLNCFNLATLELPFKVFPQPVN